MKRYKKIPAQLVVASRDVLEVRPRSSAPPPPSEERDDDYEQSDERWDNSPCTD